MNTPFDSSFGFFAIGGLKLNSKFKSSRLAKQLPGSLPVLTGVVSDSEFDAVAAQATKGSITFKVISFAHGSGTSRNLLQIRIQIGETQLNWLADMSDFEVWQALDAWRRQKQMPFSLECGNQAIYAVVDCEDRRLSFDALRSEISSKVSPEFWEVATTLAANGFVEASATTDMPDYCLKQVAVNVLVTKRLRRFVKGALMATKPIFATAGSAGAGLGQ